MRVSNPDAPFASDDAMRQGSAPTTVVQGVRGRSKNPFDRHLCVCFFPLLVALLCRARRMQARRLATLQGTTSGELCIATASASQPAIVFLLQGQRCQS